MIYGSRCANLCQLNCCTSFLIMGYEPHILCVLPTAWPLQNAPAAMNATWMLECDRVVFAVSHDQLRVAPASNLANRVSVEPTHARYNKSLGDWKFIRAAIEVAANHHMGEMDWLLMVEADVYVRLPIARRYLSRFAPDEPLFMGACACHRAPGMNLFSRGALSPFLSVSQACLPDFGPDWVTLAFGSNTNGGSGDKGIVDCLLRANLPCHRPLDSHGNVRVAAFGVPITPGSPMLRNISFGEAFCPESKGCLRSYDAVRTSTHQPPDKGKRSPCYSHGTFVFHPVKTAALMAKIHRIFAPAPAHSPLAV